MQPDTNTMVLYVRDLGINALVLLSLEIVEVISHEYQEIAVEQLFTITLRIRTSGKCIKGE